MFTYTYLNTAFRILLPTSTSPAKPLIATHRAKYIRTDGTPSSGEHDTLSLGPGPFVAALEAATGVTAEIVGKPGKTFFETVIASLGLRVSDDDQAKIAIVGDDIETEEWDREELYLTSLSLGERGGKGPSGKGRIDEDFSHPVRTKHRDSQSPLGETTGVCWGRAVS